MSKLSDDEIARKLKKKEEQEKREEEIQNVWIQASDINLNQCFLFIYFFYYQEVTWYHEGSDEMRHSRISIAQYSLRRYLII